MKVNVDNTTTASRQQVGVWATFGDSSFLVGHMGNLKFQRILNRMQAPHREKIRKGTIDPGESKKILCKAMSEGLIYDWKDVIDAKGVDVAFDSVTCERALMNNDDLREFLQDFAGDIQNYKDEQEESDSKS